METKDSYDIPLILKESMDRMIQDIKKRSVHNKYFQNTAMNSVDLVHMLSKDYIETISVSYQVGNISLLKDKLLWFKEMYASRFEDAQTGVYVKEFFSAVRDTILFYCGEKDGKLNALLKEIDDEIESIFNFQSL